MPHMYPSTLDPQTKSGAEARLYNVLRDQLGPDYHVFYSVRWHGIDRKRNPYDGEADFIIAHPRDGILVIEVKGGGIRYDPLTKKWFSRNYQGNEFEIRNPVDQAKDS